MLLDMGTNTQSFHAPVTTVSLIWDVKEHKATLMGKKGGNITPRQMVSEILGLGRPPLTPVRHGVHYGTFKARMPKQGY